MFELINEGILQVNNKPTPARKYKNKTTGTEITTHMVFKDKFGNQWWIFEDLFQLPFVRQFVSKQVLEMYGNGVTMFDIRQWAATQKASLKNQADPERYERCYGQVLELEALAERVADPIRQCMGLTTVYVLFNDERPDVYSNEVQAQKMTAMANDLDLQGFFLNWLTGIMARYGKLFSGLSQIASTARP